MTTWSFNPESIMRALQIVEAKARFSALLAEVEAGEEIAITRHGKVVARLVPDTPRVAADVFRGMWNDADIDLAAPADAPAEPVAPLD
jgi:prevent-host-death family protein